MARPAKCSQKGEEGKPYELNSQKDQLMVSSLCQMYGVFQDTQVTQVEKSDPKDRFNSIFKCI